MNLLARIWRRPPLPQIDLHDPTVASDPFPHYELLRQGGPVHFLAGHGFWIVLGHDEVKSAFERPQIFSSAPYRDIDSVLLAADPPRHTAIRRLVSRHFSAETLNRVTEAAARQAAALIAPEMDMVEDYGIPVTGAVASTLIGFAEGDMAEILSAHQATMSAPLPPSSRSWTASRTGPRCSRHFDTKARVCWSRQSCAA
jgi:cytochrome P450